MHESAEKICSVCGKRPAEDQIYFFSALSGAEQEKCGAAAAELDMLLCKTCAERVFKHLKRLFTLRDLGLCRRDRPRARSWNRSAP